MAGGIARKVNGVYRWQAEIGRSYNMQEYPESNSVFRLLKRGLVIIEHNDRPDHFMLVRLESLTGSEFRGFVGQSNVGMSGTSLSTNAPPAMLQPSGKGWLVDISLAAAPGPGPVWFHNEFETCKAAVEAVEDCFFGSRIDNDNESLENFYGTRCK